MMHLKNCYILSGFLNIHITNLIFVHTYLQYSFSLWWKFFSSLNLASFFGPVFLFIFNHVCYLSFLNLCVCVVCILVYLCVHVCGHMSRYMFAHVHMEAINWNQVLSSVTFHFLDWDKISHLTRPCQVA